MTSTQEGRSHLWTSYDDGPVLKWLSILPQHAQRETSPTGLFPEKDTQYTLTCLISNIGLWW